MLPTPCTSHIDYCRVYDPAEDSFLLIDTLSAASEVQFLTNRFKHAQHAPLALEIGVGSGVVLSFLTTNARQLLGRSDVLAMGTDLNIFAVKGATRTVHKAAEMDKELAPDSATLLDILQGDLATPLRHNLMDIILFNPPYVPSEDVPRLPSDGDDAKNADFALLALATDGGVDGMEVTDRLLDELPNLFSDNAVAYIIAMASNKPERIKARIIGFGPQWRAATVSKRRAGWENLQVIRVWLGPHNHAEQPGF